MTSDGPTTVTPLPDSYKPVTSPVVSCDPAALERAAGDLRRPASQRRELLQRARRLRDPSTGCTTVPLTATVQDLDSTGRPTRPPHSIFNDEVGEWVIGQRYRGVITRFGAPKDGSSTTAAPDRQCVRYDIVGESDDWKVCFSHGRVVSAAAGS